LPATRRALVCSGTPTINANTMPAHRVPSIDGIETRSIALLAWRTA
jgi:hypothetical protein